MKGIENKITALKESHKIQGSDGNWNYDPYMQGMYNGLELALAMFEDRVPSFRNAPDQFLSESTTTVLSVQKEEV